MALQCIEGRLNIPEGSVNAGNCVVVDPFSHPILLCHRRCVVPTYPVSHLSLILLIACLVLLVLFTVDQITSDR